jgi:hypothetical protein
MSVAMYRGGFSSEFSQLAKLFIIMPDPELFFKIIKFESLVSSKEIVWSSSFSLKEENRVKIYERILFYPISSTMAGFMRLISSKSNFRASRNRKESSFGR